MTTYRCAVIDAKTIKLNKASSVNLTVADSSNGRDDAIKSLKSSSFTNLSLEQNNV